MAIFIGTVSFDVGVRGGGQERGEAEREHREEKTGESHGREVGGEESEAQTR